MQTAPQNLLVPLRQTLRAWTRPLPLRHPLAPVAQLSSFRHAPPRPPQLLPCRQLLLARSGSGPS